MKLFTHEPAAWAAALQAILALAVAFGLHLTSEQTGCIMAVAAALGGLIVRQSVTPTCKRAEEEQK